MSVHLAAVVEDDYEALRDELWIVRTAGITRLRGLTIPKLGAAARFLDAVSPLPAAIEKLIRQAIERVVSLDEPTADAAASLFGLVTGLRGAKLNRRRRAAAEALSVAFDTFRKARVGHPSPERILVEQVAEMILELLALSSPPVEPTSPAPA